MISPDYWSQLLTLVLRGLVTRTGSSILFLTNEFQEVSDTLEELLVENNIGREKIPCLSFWVLSCFHFSFSFLWIRKRTLAIRTWWDSHSWYLLNVQKSLVFTGLILSCSTTSYCERHLLHLSSLANEPWTWCEVRWVRLLNPEWRTACIGRQAWRNTMHFWGKQRSF